jgi:hypothetical protein
MDLRAFFSQIEASGLSTWMRESPSLLAFPSFLVVHAIGMGFLVGANAAMDLRILGFARRIPLSATEGLVPIMRFGFWVNAVSGLFLLIAYPTKNLTNPVFFLKLSLIAIALINTAIIRKYVRAVPFENAATPMKAQVLACASLVIWTGAIVAGRLLAYTYVHLDPSGNPY